MDNQTPPRAAASAEVMPSSSETAAQAISLPKMGQSETVTVVPGVVYTIDADKVSFSQQGNDLVAKAPDGGELVFQDYFTFAANGMPPALSLADGAVIAPEQIMASLGDLDLDALAPAAGVNPAAFGGGGRGAFTTYEQGDIGNGLGVLDLLGNLDMTFGTPEPEDDPGLDLAGGSIAIVVSSLVTMVGQGVDNDPKDGVNPIPPGIYANLFENNRPNAHVGDNTEVISTISVVFTPNDDEHVTSTILTGFPAGIELTFGNDDVIRFGADGVPSLVSGPGAVVVNADGSLTIPGGLETNIRVTGLPENSDADFSLTARVTIQDDTTGNQTATLTVTQAIVVDAVANLADIATDGDREVNEDNAVNSGGVLTDGTPRYGIGFSAAAQDTDGSEEITAVRVTISGLESATLTGTSIQYDGAVIVDGAVLSVPASFAGSSTDSTLVKVGIEQTADGYVLTLTPVDTNGTPLSVIDAQQILSLDMGKLQVQLPQHSDDDFSVKVAVTTGETVTSEADPVLANNTATQTTEFKVTVAAVADEVTIGGADNRTTDEDATTLLDGGRAAYYAGFTAAVTDKDGSESLTRIEVSFTDQSAIRGTATGLSIAGTEVGTTVTGVSVYADYIDQAGAVQHGVVPATATYAGGVLTLTFADGARVQNVYFDQSHGTPLALILPQHADDDFSVSVAVTSTETNPIDGTPALLSRTTTESFDLTVKAVADVATDLGISVPTENQIDGKFVLSEDGSITPTFTATFADNDGSETHLLKVSVPEGWTVSTANGSGWTANGDGTYSIDVTGLGANVSVSGLTLHPPANSDADGQVILTAISTETNAEGAILVNEASTFTTATLVVDAVADTPVGLTASDKNVIAAPNGTVVVEGRVAFTDKDGSEDHFLIVNVPKGWGVDGVVLLTKNDVSAIVTGQGGEGQADLLASQLFPRHGAGSPEYLLIKVEVDGHGNATFYSQSADGSRLTALSSGQITAYGLTYNSSTGTVTYSIDIRAGADVTSGTHDVYVKAVSIESNLSGDEVNITDNVVSVVVKTTIEADRADDGVLTITGHAKVYEDGAGGDYVLVNGNSALHGYPVTIDIGVTAVAGEYQANESVDVYKVTGMTGAVGTLYYTMDNGVSYHDVTTGATEIPEGAQLYFVPSQSNSDVDVVLSISAHVTDPDSGANRWSDPVNVTLAVDAVADAPTGLGVNVGYEGGHTAAVPGGAATVSGQVTFHDTDGSENFYLILNVPKGWSVGPELLTKDEIGSINEALASQLFPRNGANSEEYLVIKAELDGNGHVAFFQIGANGLATPISANDPYGLSYANGTLSYAVKVTATEAGSQQDVLYVKAVAVENGISGAEPDLTNNAASIWKGVSLVADAVDGVSVTGGGLAYEDGEGGNPTSFTVGGQSLSGYVVAVTLADSGPEIGMPEVLTSYRVDALPTTGALYYSIIEGGATSYQAVVAGAVIPGSATLYFVPTDKNSDADVVLSITAKVTDPDSGAVKDIAGSVTVVVDAVADAPTITLTVPKVVYDGDHAGYSNVLGIYHYDSAGHPTDLEIILLNSDGPNQVGRVLETLQPGQTLGTDFGLFIIANGAGKVDADSTLGLVQKGGGTFGVTVGGKDVGNAFFSDKAFNSDGTDHIRVTPNADGSYTVGFEDLWQGGDKDYDDLIVTIGQGWNVKEDNNQNGPINDGLSVGIGFTSKVTDADGSEELTQVKVTLSGLSAHGASATGFSYGSNTLDVGEIVQIDGGEYVKVVSITRPASGAAGDVVLTLVPVDEHGNLLSANNAHQVQSLDLSKLRVVLPSDSDDDFTVTVGSTSTETNPSGGNPDHSNDSATSYSHFKVVVDAVADAPANLTASVSNAHTSSIETVSVGNVPAGVDGVHWAAENAARWGQEKGVFVSAVRVTIEDNNALSGREDATLTVKADETASAGHTDSSGHTLVYPAGFGVAGGYNGNEIDSINANTPNLTEALKLTFGEAHSSVTLHLSVLFGGQGSQYETTAIEVARAYVYDATLKFVGVYEVSGRQDGTADLTLQNIGVGYSVYLAPANDSHSDFTLSGVSYPVTGNAGEGDTVSFTASAQFDDVVDGSEHHYLLVEVPAGWSVPVNAVDGGTSYQVITVAGGVVSGGNGELPTGYTYSGLA
ncbi:MAG: DUF4114 domain-containing protein, partial [Rhodospirillaceae bacterium]|nr:DUF4114 domain-containing protein [Rhodospirillaceae bacterium]